ncbi:MAG TPA: HEAT repeat domain-containing protein [Gemmataceae bacterium]|nr:HEAT repeat domain-containing protein [Gemmataceae bacterium]
MTALLIQRRSSHEQTLARLHDPNPAVRVAAIRTLDGDADADLLLAALKDADADVRLVSVMQLEARRSYREPMTDAGKKAAALVELLDDRHAGVRRSAAYALGRMLPGSEAPLTAALKDSNPRVRAGAAYVWGCVPDPRESGPTPEELRAVRPLLRDLLNDEDAEVRRNAERALDRLGRFDKE